MDPWQPCPANSFTGDDDDDDISCIIPNVVDLALHNRDNSQVYDQNSTTTLSPAITDFSEHQNQSDSLTFGDNFQPFVKLSDSQQYLESLEKKLKKIQKGGNKGPDASSILRSLGETKESCMIKLLSNSVEQLTVDQEIFEELKVNPLLKKLAPEKQALTAEELVHLLKADQLEILLSNNNVDEQVTSEADTEKVPSSSEETEKPPPAGEDTEKDKDSTENLSTAEDILEASVNQQ